MSSVPSQIALVILLFSVISGCNSKPPSGMKTFVFCSEGSPTIFNPQLAADGPSFDASSQPMYNRLVDFTRGTTELRPSLAESWKISEDGLKYSFFLRSDVKFHQTSYFNPTRNFDSSDVVFTFKRMLDKGHPYNKVNGGGYEYFNSMGMSDLIEDVKAVSKNQVDFILTRREAPFLANLAMDFASIISKEYGESLLKEEKPQRLDTYPVGTGPFKFKSYIKDTLIRYNSNKVYFEGPSKIKELVIAITPDPSVRSQKLKKGECHFIKEPSPSDLSRLEANPSLKVLKAPGLNVGYLAMNTEKKALKNLKVRKAISLALKRDSYIEAIYLGKASLAKSPLPPGTWAYDSTLEDFELDLELARKLIRESGEKLPIRLELWTLPVSRPYNPNGKKMGEMIQQDLKQIGIETNLVTYDWPTYLAKSRKGEHELIQLGWTGDNGDPDNFLYILLSCQGVIGGSNMARFCDKKFDQIVRKAKASFDQEERKKYYRQALRVFREQVPWVPIAHANVYRAMSKDVVGYKIHPLGTESFYRVSLSSW